MKRVGWHGTSESIGKQIEKTGKLFPRYDKSSNWESGAFGGNPSNPNLVYVTLDRKKALEYMRQVSRKEDGRGALVSVLMDWKYAVPDEDVVFEELQYNNKSPIWDAFALVLEVDKEEAKRLFEEEFEFVSDSQVAEYMKNTAEAMGSVLSDSEMRQIYRNSLTVGCSKPLKVLDIEYFGEEKMANDIVSVAFDILKGV